MKKPSRSFLLNSSLSVLLAITLIVGLNLATADGGGSQATPAAASEDKSYDSLPVCEGAPARHESTDKELIPEMVDEETGETVSKERTVESHSITSTDVAEAATKLSFLTVPSRLPSWASCQVANVHWDESGGGGLQVAVYDSSTVLTATREVLFNAYPLGPALPPSGGKYEEVEEAEFNPATESRADIHRMFRDVDAGSGTGEAIPGSGTRIVWKNAEGNYFELIGVLEKEEMIDVARSLAPAN